jgi:cyclin C
MTPAADKANLICVVPAGCLQIACVILQKDLKSWFAELNVDIEKIQEIARYVINLFELWKSYDEKKDIQSLLAKMPKPKTQPSR